MAGSSKSSSSVSQSEASSSGPPCETCADGTKQSAYRVRFRYGDGTLWDGGHEWIVPLMAGTPCNYIVYLNGTELCGADYIRISVGYSSVSGDYGVLVWIRRTTGVNFQMEWRIDISETAPFDCSIPDWLSTPRTDDNGPIAVCPILSIMEIKNAY